MNLKSLLFLLLLASLSFTKAQQIAVPNLSGSYLPQSYLLFNPASIKEATNKANMLLSHKQGTGLFSVFSQNYFNANLCFGADSIKKHGIGIRVINDQAGKYIGINRIALLYNYSLVLTEQYSLHLGVAPTIINLRKKAQNFGGSATKGNLDLGLWFKAKELTLGAAINQIIQNNLIAIEEVSQIKSQYVLNAKYRHKVHPFVSLDYQVLFKINSGLTNEEVMGISVNYYKHYRTSINYEQSGSLYFLLGLQEFSVPNLEGKISIDFIYGLSVLKNSYKQRNVIELMMNYEF